MGYLKIMGATTAAIVGAFNFASGNTFLRQRGLTHEGVAWGTIGIVLGIGGGLLSGMGYASWPIGLAVGTVLSFVPAHVHAAHLAGRHDAQQTRARACPVPVSIV